MPFVLNNTIVSVGRTTSTEMNPDCQEGISRRLTALHKKMMDVITTKATSLGKVQLDYWN